MERWILIYLTEIKRFYFSEISGSHRAMLSCFQASDSRGKETVGESRKNSVEMAERGKKGVVW